MFNRIPGRWKTVAELIFIAAVIGVLFLGISVLLKAKHTVAKNMVHFEVQSSGGYSIITLDAGNVKIPKSTTVTAPWRRSISIPSGTIVYLTASNPTQTGTLSCSISIDNWVASQDQTDAPKDGVACGWIIP